MDEVGAAPAVAQMAIGGNRGVISGDESKPERVFSGEGAGEIDVVANGRALELMEAPEVLVQEKLDDFDVPLGGAVGGVELGGER